MKKNNKHREPAVFKTEEQLKEEAKLRSLEEQAAPDTRSSRQKKADNYWYHYKWHTIGGALALVLLVFFLGDMVFRTKPDTTVVVLTQRYLSQELLDELSQSLEEVAWDFNGDKKVVVDIHYLQMPGQQAQQAQQPGDSPDTAIAQTMGTQQDYANTVKLMAMLEADSDPIWLMDDYQATPPQPVVPGEEQPVDLQQAVYERFRGEANRQVDGLPVGETLLATQPFARQLTGMSFYLRDGQAMRKDAEYYGYCLELVQALALEQQSW